MNNRTGSSQGKERRIRAVFVKYRQRSEQALIDVIIEACKNGVSARKMRHPAESSGIESISAAEVSEMNKSLDEMLKAFRERALEAEYPVLRIDAQIPNQGSKQEAEYPVLRIDAQIPNQGSKQEAEYPVLRIDVLYENIREDNRIESKAVMVVKAVNMEGGADIIAVEVMENESEDTCKMLFDSLKARGVEKVRLCVSDARKGLKAAIRKSRLGALWQRCKVHFMRNVLSCIPQKQKEEVAAQLKLIWQAPDADTARKLKNDFVNAFYKRFPKATGCLEEGFEDSIQYYNFKLLDQRKISSTNTLERLNEKIRRRTGAVGVFPGLDSYIRLVTSYLIEYAEDKLSGACYIKAQTLKLQKELIESSKAA